MKVNLATAFAIIRNHGGIRRGSAFSKPREPAYKREVVPVANDNDIDPLAELARLIARAN